MTHDTVLVFSKTWGMIYLLVFFLAAVVWAYCPSKKEEFEKAARWPLEDGDGPCR